MKKYIGTKCVSATPMTRAEYNVYRSWALPDNEDGADEGYLVEYLDGGKPNDSRHTGYISWSPKEQFDKAYRETSGLTFGMALDSIEAEIVAKGLTAPRVTPADIEANIAQEVYFTAGQGWKGAHPENESQPAIHLNLLTFCVLVLRNGFIVTGESACASPENFDANLGRKIARENAKQKLWPLMGYALKQILSTPGA